MRYEVYRTAGGGTAVEAFYDPPTKPLPPPNNHNKEAADAIRANAGWQIRQGYGQNEDERVMLRKAFAEARALSIADEDVVFGRTSNALTD